MTKERSVKRIFIDTSVFIRLLTNDDTLKAADCRSLFELIEEGKLRPYVSNIVVLEIIYVLTRRYGFARRSVLAAIHQILEMRNLTLIEKTATRHALQNCHKLNVKYADCLIASQVPHGVSIVTYDSDFKGFPGLHPLSPTDVI